MDFCTKLLPLNNLIAASITMRLLSVLRGITVKLLQSRYRDILKAHELVSDIHLELH